MNFSASVKPLDHVRPPVWIDVWMIDQMNQHAVAIDASVSNMAYGGLQGRQLTEFVIRVNHDLDRQMLDLRRSSHRHCDRG